MAPPFIPVFIPLLPDAESLIPFLKEIDANRHYTNQGPLLQRFEEKLAERFDAPADRVATVANATCGLMLTLLASDPKPGGLCVLPAWTHEATAVAVIRAGLTPWFHDVDDASWLLDVDDVERSVAAEPRVGHVVATAPFGAAIDPEPWARLSERTGVSVVIDAAGGFDTLKGGPISAVVSLHATKVFGIGEGGVVVARDAATAARVRDLARLGLSADRVIHQAGLNAKLSEYACAVGLAGLETWPERRDDLVRLRDAYVRAVRKIPEVELWTPPGLSSTLLARTATGNADALADALKADGVETRRWWHRGCHRQPAMADYPKTALPVTERLVESVLGLPFHPCMGVETVEHVVDRLADFFARGNERDGREA